MTMEINNFVLWLIIVGFCNTSGLKQLTSLNRFVLRHAGEKLSHSFKLSPMVDNMTISRTNEIHSAIKEMEISGKKVYSLCVGEPNYEPPTEVIDATVSAVRTGLTKYTPVSGSIVFRNAIATDFTKRKGVICTADHIVVTNGAKQAVLQALMSVVKPGDKVLLPAPYWTSYPDMVKMCGGEPVVLPTDAASGFCLQPEVLRRALSDISVQGGSVACIIMCNPHNPTGSVPSKRQLEALSEVLLAHPQVVVISDEIYERLLHDGAEHTSIASLDGMGERTVTVNGPSKAFSMTGFRIGYCVAPLGLARAMGKLQSQMTSCASSISQHAALAALTLVEETNPCWLPSRMAELTAQRDLAHAQLTAIPHVHCTKPSGAFYLFPDVSHYFGKRLAGENGCDSVEIGDAHQLCVALLRSQRVALVPGDAFGAPNNVRLCYAADQHTIKEAIHRLKLFLESLH